MVMYSGLRAWADPGKRNSAIDGLLKLRKGLKKDVSQTGKWSSVLIATWNIRDFGGHRLNPEPRRPEALYYIAEVIEAFDLVGVQEVNQDMATFRALMALLGSDWDYIVTDTTEGDGGNMERLAFVFDRRKIRFRNMVGEVVLPTKRGEERAVQFARTPFVASFQAGWYKFSICTVHILYGKDTGPKLEERKAEIAKIAKFFAERQKKEHEDYIILGDFNIISPEHDTMKALEDNGFTVPKELKVLPGSAVASANHYDQIAFRTKAKQVELKAAGVFDWSQYVFGEDDFATYQPTLPRKKPDAPVPDIKAYRKWRTWQMSDHLPMWVELAVDFTEDYLGSLKSTATPLADFKPERDNPG